MKEILENKVYQQILKDTFGGVLYQEGTQNKYDSKELLSLWNKLSLAEKEFAGGIMKGVFNFLNS